MQPTTILLISSSHANWVRLQAMLRKHRYLHVIGEACQHDDALRIAVAEQPDVIITGSDLPNIPVVSLVEAVRTGSPTSRIVVVGKLLERGEHVRLTELGVGSFLLWEDVTVDTIGRVIEDVRAGLRVASNAAAERTVIPPLQERRLKQRGCDIVLTDEERISLNGTVTGLTQREIATELHASVATVERLLAGLRGKLGVPTTCALCARAVHVSLVMLDN